MPIQIIFSRLISQLKNTRFWLAVVFGLAFSLVFHQEMSLKLWPFESIRLQIVSYLSVILFPAICFWFLEIILLPRFTRMSRSQKSGVILASVLLPIVLAIAVIDPGELLDKTVYFLLPVHAIEVEVQAENGQKTSDIVLTGFFTEAQGPISFNTLEIRGWERIGNELILTDPIHNQITWRGRTGEKASLSFKSGSDLSQAIISWNGARLGHELLPGTSQDIRISKKFQIPFYADWPIFAMTAYLSVLFVAFTLCVLLVTFPGVAVNTSHQKKMWLIHALPMYLVWSLYLLVFWPGFMSPDSISQWSQIVTGKLVQAHPVGHTLTMWLITRFWFSPAAVAIVQILALGGILGWGVSVMREHGAPDWLAWLVTIMLALSPANSALSITIWKDVLFSAVVVALTILIFKIVVTQGRWLNQKKAWVSLGKALTFVSLYRLNGFFVAIGALLLVTWYYRIYYQALVKASGLFLIVYFLFTGVLFRMLDVQVANMARDELVIANLLAGHMQAGTFISSEDQTILKPALLVSPWPYTCERNSAFIFNPTLDRRYLIEHSREISNIALKATLQNPMETMRHFACQGASVYRIPQEYRNEMMMHGIIENDYGIAETSLLPALRDPLMDFLINVTDLKSRGIIQFVWRMPFWMYLCVIGCILFCIRNKTSRPLLILLPGLLTVLPYLILTLGQIFRYVYSMYLVGILFSGYFLVCAFPKANLTPDEELNGRAAQQSLLQ